MSFTNFLIKNPDINDGVLLIHFNGLMRKNQCQTSYLCILEAISIMQITFKYKARADEKAEHTREYVSILRRAATP
jgi:hypothetical protein